MVLYREEETFWIYMNGVPFKRATHEPAYTDILELQRKNPTAAFTVKREHRVTEELRSFQPLQREDKYAS
jgi:hypothetical protein